MLAPDFRIASVRTGKTLEPLMGMPLAVQEHLMGGHYSPHGQEAKKKRKRKGQGSPDPL